MHGYAEIKGHQFRIIPGEKIKVPYLGIEKGAIFDIPSLLMVNDGSKDLFGDDCKGFVAKATVVDNNRDKKTIVFKKKAKQGYKKSRGHRQRYSEIVVNEILKQEGE